MKIKFINNSILARHFLNYKEVIKNENKLVSSNISDNQILELYDKNII